MEPGSHIRRVKERKQDTPPARSVSVMLKMIWGLLFLPPVCGVALAEKAALIRTQGSSSSAGWLWTCVCSPVLLFRNLLGPFLMTP